MAWSKRETGQVDNAALDGKIELRRRFLKKYHGGTESIMVMDTCAGSKAIWSPLCAEFPQIRYTGIDLKPKPGRLKRDSVDMLRIGMARRADVVDVDTYGQPFKHILAMREAGLPSALTLFLTVGMVMKQVDGVMIAALGINFPVPTFIGKSLADRHLLDAMQNLLAPLRLVYAEEMKLVGGPKQRGLVYYYGMRFE